MTQVMITNGGPHPPEKWAMISAERIFDISSVDGERRIQAQKIQLSIAEVLMPLHSRVQATERSRLNEDAEYIFSPYNPEEYLDGIIADIRAVVKDTPWQEHFAKPEVQTAARNVIASHIATAQHVERLWHGQR